MLNIKNYQKYSDKFTIHVLDLTQIELAEKEDKEHGLDKWGRLFKALTWEDFKMISMDNKCMQEAGETLFTLNGDDRIRDLCEAREDYRRTWDSVKLDMEEKNTIIREKEIAIKEKDSLITSLEAQVAELQRQLQSLRN